MYKVLKKNIFRTGDFSLTPIRFDDRWLIMKWRNEQIYHLRQSEPLTVKDQESYFSNVISKLFQEELPNQLLFSLIRNNVCIGYGGLVHINWGDKNAEVSFLMDTELEKTSFEEIWSIYLALIEKVAFIELKFHKIYTYAFDLRPHLFQVLEKNGFEKDARLKDHHFHDGRYVDVIIHRKIK
jgi:RimJ/RimL family protein N-acetyltransferase